MDISTLLILTVAVALFFDFTNGFHDTANSIATMVGTRAVPPQLAVAMAAVLNFFGAFLSTEVAATVAKDIVDPSVVAGHLPVVLAGLVGAITWNLITWYVGLPSSSSHALIGGMVGATVAHVGISGVFWREGVMPKVMLPALTAPTIGFIASLLLIGLLMRVFRNANPRKANTSFKRLQYVSGAFLSLTHGMNDAQKTMGIIMLALISTNNIDPEAGPPPWVVVSAATAMGLGTYAGGWRIIKTLGTKVVKMEPVQGFAASGAAAGVLYSAAHFGFPVSTTHCVSGCVMGAGAGKRLSSVRWNVASDIVSAWIFTLPAAAFVGAVAYALVSVHVVVLLAAPLLGAVLLRRWTEGRPTTLPTEILEAR